jgi:NhaA family Na+:H+ antiporter
MPKTKKLLGTVGGIATWFFSRRNGTTPLTWADIATVGALAGIGFTVSLLMNELAFREYPAVIDQGTVAVLLGSGAAMVVAAVLTTMRSRHYRRLGEQKGVGGAFSRTAAPPLHGAEKA